MKSVRRLDATAPGFEPELDAVIGVIFAGGEQCTIWRIIDRGVDRIGASEIELRELRHRIKQHRNRRSIRDAVVVLKINFWLVGRFVVIRGFHKRGVVAKLCGPLGALNGFRRRFHARPGDQFFAAESCFFYSDENGFSFRVRKQHGLAGRAVHHVAGHSGAVVLLNVVLQVGHRDRAVPGKRSD